MIDEYDFSFNMASLDANKLRKRQKQQFHGKNQMIHIETMGQRNGYFSREKYQPLGDEFMLQDKDSLADIVHDEDFEVDSEDEDDNDNVRLIKGKLLSFLCRKCLSNNCIYCHSDFT